MAIPGWVTPALSFGSSVFGLFSGKGKKSGTAASRAVESLLLDAANKVKNYDPYKDIDALIQQSQLDAERLADKSLSSVFSRYAQTGSAGYLPDTARSSVLRGVSSDISNNLATLEANLKYGAIDKWMNLARGVITSASAGRGEVLPSNNNFDPKAFVSSFSDLLHSIWK